MSHRAPLRVGLLLDSLRAPAWVARVVDDLLESEHAEVVLVVLNDERPARERAWKGWRHVVYRAYSKLDRAFFGRAPDPFARVDLQDRLDTVEVVRASPRRTRWSDYIEGDDLEAIESARLDVVLRFGFRILRGRILETPRYGVWSYHHDDNRIIRGGPPGFWEVMHRHPTTGSVLQRLTEDLDGGEVLYRSWSPTHQRSVVRNREHVYWKSTAFVRRCLQHLARTGELPGPAGEDRPRPYAGPLYRKPRNLEATLQVARLILRGLAGWCADRITRKEWFLAYRFEPDSEALPSLHRFRPLFPPRGCYWADPFPVRHQGRWYVFMEEYVYANRKGHISVLELDGQGARGPATRVVVEPTHLSYPFVFELDGEIFMIPETAAQRQVRLYRCESFPDAWSLAGVLLEDVAAVDTTLHRMGDRFWLFTNIAEPGARHAHDEVHLFWADSLLGPWTAAAANPAKSDARSSRPAGRLFEWGGQLYRPAQDCSRHYGGAIAFNRVLEISEEGLREEVVSTIEPHWRPGLIGTHTWNRAGELTVVDGLRRRWRWRS